MAYNKVLFPDKTIAIDLTQDTVTEEKLAIGITAHNNKGERIIGTAFFGVSEEGLQYNKIITPTEEEQIVSPDAGYTALKQVTVEGIQTETKNIITNGTYEPSKGSYFNSVTVNTASSITTQPLDVIPTKETQEFLPEDYDVDAFNKVTVEPLSLTAIEVSPQTYTDKVIEAGVDDGINDYSEYAGFSKVTVKGVTKDIDSNIRPENIRANVYILGVQGEYSAAGSALPQTTLLPQYALPGYYFYLANGTLSAGKMEIYNGEFEEVI